MRLRGEIDQIATTLLIDLQCGEIKYIAIRTYFCTYFGAEKSTKVKWECRASGKDIRVLTKRGFDSHHFHQINKTYQHGDKQME